MLQPHWVQSHEYHVSSNEQSGFTWERKSMGKNCRLLNILLSESSHKDLKAWLVLGSTLCFCPSTLFLFRPVAELHQYGWSESKGTGWWWWVFFFFTFRIEFRQHTNRKLDYLPIVTSLWKKIYSNVVIGCNVAMLSSSSFSTACRAHELTRKFI